MPDIEPGLENMLEGQAAKRSQGQKVVASVNEAGGLIMG